jgi:hypothetical protein
MRFIKITIITVISLAVVIAPVLELVLKATATAQSTQAFADVPTNHAYYKEIQYLQRNQIAKGYQEEGIRTFRPNKPITRAEFLKVLIATLHDQVIFLQSDAPFPLYKDVQFQPHLWFMPYVVTAKIDGIMKGTKEGNIELFRDVSRAEAITMVTRALELDPEKFSKIEIPYTDVKTSHWFYSSVQMTQANKLFSTQGNLFQPTRSMTRGEMASLLYAALKLKQDAGENSFLLDIVSSSPNNKPDLVLTGALKTNSADGMFQGAVKLYIENLGTGEVAAGTNFCIQEYPDLHETCLQDIATELPPLYPQKQFIIYRWGACDQTYTITNEVIFKVNLVDEAREDNNSFKFSCN